MVRGTLSYLDEKWTHVTWITRPDGIGYEVWVRAKQGGYLVFTVMPQHYPSVGIWLDDKNPEELAAKFHANCAGWDALHLDHELQPFVVVDHDNCIMSVEELLEGDNPAHRAWAERIPVLCRQVDERMDEKRIARLRMLSRK
jgi:hypothetical protein